MGIYVDELVSNLAEKYTPVQLATLKNGIVYLNAQGVFGVDDGKYYEHLGTISQAAQVLLDGRAYAFASTQSENGLPIAVFRRNGEFLIPYDNFEDWEFGATINCIEPLKEQRVQTLYTGNFQEAFPPRLGGGREKLYQALDNATRDFLEASGFKVINLDPLI